MTDDFEAAVLTGKDDHTQIPQRLRAKQQPEWDETAALAEIGMRHIEHDMLLLEPPDDAELALAYATLKRLHAEAFGWNPPDVPRPGATRRHTDEAVRAGVDQRVGSGTAGPRVQSGERRRRYR